MKQLKLIRNTLMAFAAAFVIFFAPGEGSKAFAAEPSVSELAEKATQYLGVRYVYGGTTAKGFDCSGYVRKVFTDVGIDSLPRTAASMYKEGDKVAKSDLQEGDLVFFNTSGRGVSHVGIYIGSGQFIHSSTSKGVVKTDINDKYYWGSKYVGAKRVAQFAAN